MAQFHSELPQAGVSAGSNEGGIDPVPTVHDLRHTAISLWLTRGLTPFEVSKMVGHTDLKMIEKRYGHLYESELQKKIDRIGAEA